MPGSTVVVGRSAPMRSTGLPQGIRPWEQALAQVPKDAGDATGLCGK